MFPAIFYLLASILFLLWAGFFLAVQRIAKQEYIYIIVCACVFISIIAGVMSFSAFYQGQKAMQDASQKMQQLRDSLP